MKRWMLTSAMPLLLLGACERVDDNDQAGNETTAAQADGETGQQAEMTSPTASSSMDSELSIAENLEASGDLSTFNDAVAAAGLAETLAGVGPYTLFAPTDAAFQSADTGDLIDRGGPELVALISNHLVPGVVTTEDLRNAVDRGDGSTQLATMTGAMLTVRADGDDLVIESGDDTARITAADLAQANGMVQVVDGVLKPQ